MESSYMQEPDWNSGKLIEVERLRDLIIKRVELYVNRIEAILNTDYKTKKSKATEICHATTAVNRELKKYENKILRLEMEVKENVQRNES